MKEKLKEIVTIESVSKVVVMLLCVGAMNITVNAADSSTVVTNAFSAFLGVIKSIITCIGIIVILWGVFELGTAMQGNDGVMQSGAFKRIGGGLVMAIAPQLLSVIFPDSAI